MSVVYPIRVIDVEQTTASSHGNIIFHTPTSWDFHTISHTWSKGVQSWSDSIGSKLLASGDAERAAVEDMSHTLRRSYENLFKREDFSAHKCYRPFIDFLLLLHADGVRYVWLDALCINQASESGEKSQELRNMGSFYANSTGCYVCAHGFGEGFQTWKRPAPGCGGNGTDDDKTLLLPRWFSRVWTFQESLLPRTLTFIFHLSQLIKKTINTLITDLQHEGVQGPCKCVMKGYLPLPSPASLITYWDEDQYIVEEPVLSPDSDPYEMGEPVDILCASGRRSCFTCPRCGGYALIRKPNIDQLQAVGLRLPKRTAPYHQPPSICASAPAPTDIDYSDLYFIDRECIVEFMLIAHEQQMAVMSPRDEPAECTTEMDNVEDEEWKLTRFRTIVEQLKRNSAQENAVAAAEICVCEPVQVVLEAARRDCTREEDRVLSILGLLGIEGVVQLRAGKSLEAQLLDMSQQLIKSGNATTLVKLCMSQFVGNSTAKRMSWAPTLKQGFPLTGEQVQLAGQKRHLKWREMRQQKRLLALQDEVERGCERAVAEQGHVMKYFMEDLVVDCVQEDGRLWFSQVKVLWDCLFVRDTQDTNVFHLQVFDSCVDGSNTLVRAYPFQAYFSAVACLLHRVAFVGAGQAAEHNILTYQSVVRLDGHDLETRLTQFKVHLVLLGHIILPGDAFHEVCMVCAGNRTHSLHKIGIAWLVPSLHELFKALPNAKCSVGGFDDYMERFVLQPLQQDH